MFSFSLTHYAYRARGKDMTFFKEGPPENKDLDPSLEQNCFPVLSYSGIHGAGKKTSLVNGEINL